LYHGLFKSGENHKPEGKRIAYLLEDGFDTWVLVAQRLQDEGKVT
jgi:hypothetical protein